jgi:trehalose monomycolate/heme transporter
MFRIWGLLMARARRGVVGAAVVFVALGVVWGTGVFDELVGGGFDDPDAESVRAGEAIERTLGNQEVDVVALYRSETETVDDASFRDAVISAADRLRDQPGVESVVTYYDTKAEGFVADDHHATFAAITLAADDEDGKRATFRDIEPVITRSDLDVQVGGTVAFQETTDNLTEEDLARGEMYAMPFVLLLLVIIFRGLVAAFMPVLIGLVAVLGALTATRLIATATDVSTFAVNTITLLGLGMAIDYSLLMVSRFREELEAGRSPIDGVVRTVSSAGRTVLVSALTIVVALSSLLLFPQVFLRSMGMGGMAAVTVAMVGSLTLLPALLAMLGTRINALRIRLPGRKGAARSDVGRWGRLAGWAMRRPMAITAGVLAILGVLAAPSLSAEFGGVDERVMPRGEQPRAVAETLTADFPGRSSAPIDVFVRGASAGEVDDVVQRIERVDGVTGAAIADQNGNATLLTVSYEGKRTGDHAYDAVRAIRELTPPAGTDLLVGGRSALDVDRLDSLGDKLPWVGLMMAGTTFVLLFLSFGSILLPIKAIAMNIVSIAASFGAVVWVFQDGHLSGLLDFTPTGFLEPTIPILLLVILFGLSTDYEVFLLSRIREAWDETGEPTEATVTGVQRTGGIITAAALLLIVVVAGFATGQITFAKMIGVGMITAILVDATLVRMLLVPALMRVFGRASWWLPGHMRAIYDNLGIRENDAPTGEPAPA